MILCRKELEKLEKKLEKIEESKIFQLCDKLNEDIKKLESKIDSLEKKKDELEEKLNKLKSKDNNILNEKVSFDLFFLIFIYFSLFMTLIYGMVKESNCYILCSILIMIVIYGVYKKWCKNG